MISTHICSYNNPENSVTIYLKIVSVFFGHTLKIIVVLDLTDIVRAKTVPSMEENSYRFGTMFNFELTIPLRVYLSLRWGIVG